MRHAICYISSLKEGVDPQTIKELLNHWQVKNEARDIKGILLYSEGNFFQILEGEKRIVLSLFEKIQEDARHRGIIQVIGRDHESRPYEDYLVDIVDEIEFQRNQSGYYIEALRGFEPDIKKVMESMLETFLASNNY